MKKTIAAKRQKKVASGKLAVRKTETVPAVAPGDVVRRYLDAALKAGKWMIAVWRIDKDKIHLDRTAVNFPKGDIDTAMQLIVQDVQQLKNQ